MSKNKPSKNHKGSDAWRREVAETSGEEGSEGNLLDRIHYRFPLTKEWIPHTGRRMDHTQIQWFDPWEVLSERSNPNITRIRWHIYHPITKEKGTYDTELTEDTGMLMVLVRSPKPDGGYDDYFLARRKFQMGAKMAKIVEFTRGYITGMKNDDIGWGLFRRDFPGLEGQDFVKGVWHEMMDAPKYENTSSRMNYTSSHLIVVTLNKPMSRDELQDWMTEKKLEQEYEEKRDVYPDLSELTGEDLMSAPIVMTSLEVADALNSHPEKEWIFGDKHSDSLWDKFQKNHGHEFPELLPKTSAIPDK